MVPERDPTQRPRTDIETDVRAPQGKPTLEEVAEVAGVSRATVSRVINGSPRVSDATREAVELAIDALGYVPNRAARNLVTRRSDTVALVVAEPEMRFFSDPFFAGVVRGASQEVATSGRQLVLVMSHGDDDRERVERFLLAGHADGAILLSLHGQDPLPGTLVDHGVPAVMAGRPPEGSAVSFVDADNRGGARQATQHLLRLGRRRIATIAGPQDMPVGIDRLAGYREALMEAEIEPDEDLIEAGDFSQASGSQAMRTLLDREPNVDGLFVASDLMAAGALQLIKDRGRQVPDDIAIIGFDDSVVATSVHPPLTTVRQPVEQLGRELARLVLRDIDDGVPGEPHRMVLGTELVVRDST